MTTSFAYHRSLSPTLGVLLALALLETIVLHVVAVALWGWPVAIVVAVADLSLVLALAALLRAIRRRPVTIGEGLLTMRVGNLKIVPIPLDRVAGMRAGWTAAALKAPDVVNLALASWPNVMIDVDPPVRVRRRTVAAVAHRLDDPAAFVAAIAALRDGPAPRLPSTGPTR